MRLFIVEKLELARAIASALHGDEKKAKAYIIKGDNIITWAYIWISTISYLWF